MTRCCRHPELGPPDHPEQNTITTGTDELVSGNRTANIGVSETFLSGTSASLTIAI